MEDCCVVDQRSLHLEHIKFANKIILASKPKYKLFIFLMFVLLNMNKPKDTEQLTYTSFISSNYLKNI